MSTLRMWQGVGGACHLVPVFEMQLSDVGYGWHRVSGYAEGPPRLVSGDVVCDQPEETVPAPWACSGSWDSAVIEPPGRGCTNCGARWFDPVAIGWSAGWKWTRPTWAAPRKALQGRGVQDKALIVIAAQADGRGIGRIRMRMIQHPSAASLHPFIEDCIEPGSTVHTDGWQGYTGLKKKGYDHEVTSVQRLRRKEVSTLLPRVHLVVSLLKRWLAGTHQGGVSHEHLPYYLDEFTFRFNRRKSKSRGKLFFRLVQQAVDTGPTTYAHIAKTSKLPRTK